MNINPLTLKKIVRFRSIKRGYYSFILIMVMIFVSIFAELLVNSNALIVRYEGNLYFPTYGKIIPGHVFGLDYAYETNYRDLKQIFADEGNGDWVLMPPGFTPRDRVA